jgi:hypothetical protein
MTLRVPDPSAKSLETVRSHLSELAGRRGFEHRALNRANPTRLGLTAPHDVYFLGLDELAEGASLDAARAVGRRFLVVEGDRPVASAELADHEEGTRLQANEGPYVESTAAAIAWAEQDRELAAGDYELRLLRIPALYFVGLWLKDEQDRADVVIPLEPSPAPLEPRRKYAPAEVLSPLAERARARRGFDDVGGPTGEP